MDEVKTGSDEFLEPKELQRHRLPIIDSREKSDAGQQLALSERLVADGADIALQESKKFLGEYSPVDPKELSIEIIEGNIGEGTIIDRVIKLEMPETDKAISRFQELLQPRFGELSEEQCREIFFALGASIVLHEGIHGLLDSKPGSKFAHDLERASGIKDSKGERSTLLDEGIAYAVQAIYAPTVEPIGSLAAKAKETDPAIVRKRKLLGERLRLKVANYLEGDRLVDEDFLSFAAESMRELDN